MKNEKYKLDEYYPEEYFGQRMNWKKGVYNKLASIIQEVLRPENVVDVGCGNGILSEGFSVPYQGIEGSDAGMEACKEKGLEVLKHDLRTPLDNHKVYHLAVSIEVAEHLEEEYADQFVETLTRLSDDIVVTADNNASYHHFNPQPKAYWIKKFNEAGYYINLQAQTDILDLAKKEIPDRFRHLYNNMMVFKRCL